MAGVFAFVGRWGWLVMLGWVLLVGASMYVYDRIGAARFGVDRRRGDWHAVVADLRRRERLEAYSATRRYTDEVARRNGLGR